MRVFLIFGLLVSSFSFANYLTRNQSSDGYVRRQLAGGYEVLHPVVGDSEMHRALYVMAEIEEHL